MVLKDLIWPQLPDPQVESQSTLALCQWGSKAWKVEQELQARSIVKGIFMFSFPLSQESARVLKHGKKAWQGGGLLLDVWNLMVGCCRIWQRDPMGWIWGYGLPVDLWGFAYFKAIDDLCKDLLEVGALDLGSMEWIKLKVCFLARAPPAMWVFDGNLVFRVSLWKAKLLQFVPVSKTRFPN